MSGEAPAIGWRLAKACVTGSGHTALGVECQDRVHVITTTSGCGEVVVVATVADGAGTASRSGAGAELVVGSLADCVMTSLECARVASLRDDAPRTWLQMVRHEVIAEAAKADLPLHEYACTLLAVVAGEESAIFMQLGDGVIAVRVEETAWELACKPQRGEYANQTWFVTSPDAVERVEVRRWKGRVDTFALSSDGLESVCFDRRTGTPFGGFFDSLVATVRAAPAAQVDTLDDGLARFLADERFDGYTSDDKTLVVAVWTGS